MLPNVLCFYFSNQICILTLPTFFVKHQQWRCFILTFEIRTQNTNICQTSSTMLSNVVCLYFSNNRAKIVPGVVLRNTCIISSPYYDSFFQLKLRCQPAVFEITFLVYEQYRFDCQRGIYLKIGSMTSSYSCNPPWSFAKKKKSHLHNPRSKLLNYSLQSNATTKKI